MKLKAGEVRRLRKEIGLTQEELGIDAGISRAHVASLETGRREATSPVIRKVARALGLKSPDQIVGD